MILDRMGEEQEQTIAEIRQELIAVLINYVSITQATDKEKAAMIQIIKAL